MPIPTVSKEDQAQQDAWDLVSFQEKKKRNAEIRKNPKRFNAAVKIIMKENEDRRKAIKEENAARSKAVNK